MRIAPLALGLLCCLPLAAQNAGDAQEAQLRALIAQSPKLPITCAALPIQPPRSGWEIGMTSWVANDGHGTTYIIQRGDKADPIIALDSSGRVLRSWGTGMYVMPHAIRIDQQGNIWTTDAASSMVYKFTPQGQKLMEISVGGQPSPCPRNFCGTTDVAFAPNGNIFISDGYSNARVLEYSPDGKKIREWGSHGTGPGQFHLVHSVQVDENGIVYVADRENGRVQRFDLDGKFLGEWDALGKPFSLTLRNGAIYVATQPRDRPNGAAGWLLKVDRKTGQVLGSVESTGNHGMEALANGELMVGPGPGLNQPQWCH